MTVVLDFLCPVRLVRGGLGPVQRATMPEAAIHEHSDAAHREYDIGSYWSAAWSPDRKVDAKAEPGAVQRGPQRTLGAAVAATICAHDFSAQLGHVGPGGAWFCGFAHPPLWTLGS
jgi:hypothetical protein